MKEKWDEARKAKDEWRREKEKKKVKTTVSHWKPRTISKFFFPHMLKLQKQIFRIWVRRPLLFIYLFIFVSLVRIRIPMQVKQKASNRYVCSLWDCTDYYYLWDFDYVIWWATLIIKKILSFLFSLDSVCICLFLWLSSKAFLSNAPWPKADFLHSFPVVFPKFLDKFYL